MSWRGWEQDREGREAEGAPTGWWDRDPPPWADLGALFSVPLQVRWGRGSWQPLSHCVLYPEGEARLGSGWKECSGGWGRGVRSLLTLGVVVEFD